MMPSFGAPPRWVVMWATAIVVYVVLKGLAWSLRSYRPAPLWKHVAFLVAWPGMDVDRFLHSSRATVRMVTIREWIFAIAKMVTGIGLIGIASHSLRQRPTLVAGWLAMTGLAFVLHFGLFHVLSCMWRTAGCDARPIMNWPILAKNVSDFWGHRWNLAFRDLAHRTIFAPASRVFGPAGALLLGFFFSGLVHDLVISVPAGGGYGSPTIYFLLQGCAVLAERSRPLRRMAARVPGVARALAIVVVVVPLPLAFHSHFVTRVVSPFVVAFAELLP